MARIHKGDASREPRVMLWPRLPLGVYARRPRGDLPFPLAEPGCRLVSLARHGLWQGVQALGLEPGDEVLVPAYNCGSEVEALIRAGLTCRFYEASETLEPAQAELEALIGPRTRAMLLIHYLGFPQDARRWREWCDRHQLLLIEDCAPAWQASQAGRPVGSFGDLAIFSLYKTLPLPDGGAALLRERAGTLPTRQGAPGIAGLGKLHVQRLMTRSGTLDRVLSRPERRAEADFGLGDADSTASRASVFLLPRLAGHRVAERRRENYRRLSEEGSARVPLPFSTLPSGASPLVMPVASDGDPGLPERLERAGIKARRMWPHTHPAIPAHQFPGAAAWRRRFLALPVHQELRERDLERIVAALRGRHPRYAPTSSARLGADR